MDLYKFPKITKGFDWLKRSDGKNFLMKDDHCPTRDIFQARLDRMGREMQKMSSFEKNYSLIFAIAGEFGNNSFDHNLGNWRDEAGVYFVYDFEKKFLIIADRGQGVLATLRHVKPDLSDESEALRVAFTQPISGRAPEQRGNGLKFVDKVVKEQKFTLLFQSGKAVYTIEDGYISERVEENALSGVIAVLSFSS